MPEIAEVEVSRRFIARAITGQKIVGIFPALQDRLVFDQARPHEFVDALIGARVLGVGRRGKYFWLELDRRPWPVFHLGMSGNLVIRPAVDTFKVFRPTGWDGLRLWREGEGDRSADRRISRFCRFRLVTDVGVELFVIDPRRFGRIRLARDPAKETPISLLGFDPLLDFPSATTLRKLLMKRKSPIKTVLLDQSIFAGVGNWVADETLFQAEISPHRIASSLTQSEVAAFRQALLKIVRKAVSLSADYRRFPKGWLFHNRWGKNKAAVTTEGLSIQFDTIQGRTAAWVPGRQK